MKMGGLRPSSASAMARALARASRRAASWHSGPRDGVALGNSEKRTEERKRSALRK